MWLERVLEGDEQKTRSGDCQGPELVEPQRPCEVLAMYSEMGITGGF